MPEDWEKKWVTYVCEKCKKRDTVMLSILHMGSTWQCDRCFLNFLKFSPPRKPVMLPRKSPCKACRADNIPMMQRCHLLQKKNGCRRWVTHRCETCGRHVTQKVTKLRNNNKWLCAACKIKTEQSTASTSGRICRPIIWKTAPTTSTVPPSMTPWMTPSMRSSIAPLLTPSMSPWLTPSTTPLMTSSMAPSMTSSMAPSMTSSMAPSMTSSLTPTVTVSVIPLMTPTVTVSVTPSMTPTVTVSVTPSMTPTVTVSVTPSMTPSMTPLMSLSVTTSMTPSMRPLMRPSTAPLMEPLMPPWTPPPTQSIPLRLFQLHSSSRRPGFPEIIVVLDDNKTTPAHGNRQIIDLSQPSTSGFSEANSIRKAFKAAMKGTSQEVKSNAESSNDSDD